MKDKEKHPNRRI